MSTELAGVFLLGLYGIALRFIWEGGGEGGGIGLGGRLDDGGGREEEGFGGTPFPELDL